MASTLLNLPLFVLLAGRMTGIVLVAPVFSNAVVPVSLKAALVALSTLVMFPFAARYATPLPDTMGGLFPLLVMELGLGLLLGFAGAVVIGTVRMAGSFMSHLIGLNVAADSSPDEEDSESGVIGTFLTMVVLLLFITMDGHHWFVEAVGLSCRVAPVGTVAWRPVVFEALNKDVAATFVFAVRAAAPIVGVMFLVNIMMALVAKVSPQINILMEGYPVKMFVGVTVMAIFFPLVWPVMRGAFEALREGLAQYVRMV